jgi:uroporphyrinogen decarboxylase
MRRTLRREPVDRLPSQTNYTPGLGRKLAAHFGISPQALPARLDNHLLRLDLSHPRRLSPEGRIAYDWWGAGWDTQTEGYWHAYAPLADLTDLAHFPWPDPNAADLLADAQRALAADRGEHFAAPNFGFALFERAWSLRGFDQWLMDLVDQPAWAEELLERITDIQVALARRFVGLEAEEGGRQKAEGRSNQSQQASAAGVDGGYFGDDYGAQRSLLFSPRIWRQMFKPRLARMFAVFRDAGLPVLLHSDGDIWPILPDLVDIGLTCLNPVQPEVLDHQRLQREFGRHLSFYGGLSTQTVLPTGTPQQVRDATLACIASLAPEGTGLVLGPSHRMQSDIPAENVEAMLDAFPRSNNPDPAGVATA